MVRKISAIYENGVFRPTQPFEGLPQSSAVQITIETNLPEASQRARLLGMQKDAVLFVAPDFDAELDDTFWAGGEA